MKPNDTQHFVEEVGLFFEQVGLPRMPGKILGWLLIADPPQQSMPDLVDALQASKSSISTSTRLLIQGNLVQRISLPGKRRDYYQIQDNVWITAMNQRNQFVTAFRELAERGLLLLADEPEERQVRLKQMRDFYAFFEREMPKLLEKWDAEQKEKGK